MHVLFITVDAAMAFWKWRLLPCKQHGILIDAVAFHLLATFVIVVIRKLQGFFGHLCIKLKVTFLMDLLARLAKLSGNALATVSNPNPNLVLV